MAMTIDTNGPHDWAHLPKLARVSELLADSGWKVCHFEGVHELTDHMLRGDPNGPWHVDSDHSAEPGIAKLYLRRGDEKATLRVTPACTGAVIQAVLAQPEQWSSWAGEQAGWFRVELSTWSNPPSTTKPPEPRWPTPEECDHISAWDRTRCMACGITADELREQNRAQVAAAPEPSPARYAHLPGVEHEAMRALAAKGWVPIDNTGREMPNDGYWTHWPYPWLGQTGKAHALHLQRTRADERERVTVEVPETHCGPCGAGGPMKAGSVECALRNIKADRWGSVYYDISGISVTRTVDTVAGAPTSKPEVNPMAPLRHAAGTRDPQPVERRNGMPVETEPHPKCATCGRDLPGCLLDHCQSCRNVKLGPVVTQPPADALLTLAEQRRRRGVGVLGEEMGRKVEPRFPHPWDSEVENGQGDWR